MDSADLEPLRARLRDVDRRLLRALAGRARFPRHPLPVWPAGNPRLPEPPLPEILLALAPPGTAADPASVGQANTELVAALRARQELAAEIADAKCRQFGAGVHETLALGDRKRLLDLITDIAAELRVLDFIRTAAAEIAPELPRDLPLFLWREYLIPWTKQSELDQLLAP